LQVGTEAELDLTLPAMYRVIIKNTHPLLVLRPIDKMNQEFVYVTNLDLQIARLLGVFSAGRIPTSAKNLFAH
jgi:hypothetical protein